MAFCLIFTCVLTFWLNFPSLYFTQTKTCHTGGCKLVSTIEEGRCTPQTLPSDAASLQGSPLNAVCCFCFGSRRPVWELLSLQTRLDFWFLVTFLKTIRALWLKREISKPCPRENTAAAAYRSVRHPASVSFMSITPPPA